MVMWLELWSTSAGNRIGGYPTLDAALIIVEQIAELGGEDAVEDLFIEVWGEGDDEPVASIEGGHLRHLIPGSRTLILPSGGRQPWASRTGSPTQHVSPVAIPA